MSRQLLTAVILLLTRAPSVPAGQDSDPATFIREHYTKKTFHIPMRDGVKLHTIIYSPKNASQRYPILLNRTPYGIGPYEESEFRTRLGPNRHFPAEGYIFAYQDVRGRYMSEGTFANMRPQLGKDAGPRAIDESTDAYDTIDFLVKNVANHNGKVGLWGISYPGFYASAGMINAHSALRAVSPQAPIADWFFDDFNHHGAFFLAHYFRFFSEFGVPRPEPTTSHRVRFNFPTPDGYKFYLDVGPLKNLNTRYFKNRIAYWHEFTKHPNYDDYWQARNILPHLKKVAPAVMVVGGWYDAEDLYGIFSTYQAIEAQNPGIFNVLVVGPWWHGGWANASASSLGNISFGSNTAAFFQENMELPFFNRFLKGKGSHDLPEAYMFEVGRNAWRRFERWPPPERRKKTLFLHAGGRLGGESPGEDGHDAFPSDPARPVPYTEAIAPNMTIEYMTDDQRFASRRPDVLVYQTEPLAEPMTIAGPLLADLHVATSATDADWIVKVIDVFPDDVEGEGKKGRRLAGYQMMVRSEVIRGRFRKSYTKPEPFEPNKPTRVKLKLLDVLHTFDKGHRVMVQIHSTWFPLVDRNPQKYVPNIFEAEETDFVAATHHVFRGPTSPSALHFGVLPQP